MSESLHPRKSTRINLYHIHNAGRPTCCLLPALPAVRWIACAWCRQFGRPKEGISIGPIKFSRVAELVNGRAAMVGYAILMYIGYNTVCLCGS